MMQGNELTQGNAARRIAGVISRPGFWLIGLLLWVLMSAGRSLGTPWASAALTEVLRWAAGIGLTLALGWLLRRPVTAGYFLVTLTGAMALCGVLDKGNTVQSGMVGPYHDHQLYGSVLLLLLPLCAGTALTARSAPWRWGALAAFAAGTLCLLLSQTRSAWAGLIGAALVFGWLWLRHDAPRPQRRRSVVIPAALLTLGLASVWLLTSPAGQQAVLTHRAGTLAALSHDEGWQSRLGLWHGTMRLIEAYPVIGIGLGRYPSMQWPWTHTGSPLTPAAHPSLSTEAHSFYLQTAAETGLIGLGLYLAVLAAFAGQGLQRLRDSRRQLREQNALLIAALSALAGQGVDALASPSWQFPEASFFFWIVLGLGLASLRREEGQTVPAKVPTPLRRTGEFALSGSVAVVLAAQVLPTGLLTPVEAYNHVAASVYQSVILTQISCPTSTGYCFSLTAVYSDGSHDVTFDTGGVTGVQALFTCKLYPSPTTCSPTFSYGNSTRNQLIIRSSEVGQQIIITGSFEDVSYPVTVGAGTPAATPHTSAGMILTPSVINVSP